MSQLNDEEYQEILDQINLESEKSLNITTKNITSKANFINVILALVVFLFLNQIFVTFILNAFIMEIYKTDINFIEKNVILVFPFVLTTSCLWFGLCYFVLKKININIHFPTFRFLCIASCVLLSVGLQLFWGWMKIIENHSISYIDKDLYPISTSYLPSKTPSHTLVDDEILENHLPLYTIYIPILEPVGLELYYIDEELYFNYTTNIGQATFKAELLDDGTIVDYGYQLEYLGMESYSGKNADWQILDTVYLEIDNTLLFYTNSDNDIYVVSVIDSEKFYLFDYSNIKVSDDFVVKDLTSLLDQGLRVDFNTSPTDEAIMISPNYPYYSIEFTEESPLTFTVDRQMPLLHNPYDIQVNFRITDRHGVNYLNKDISDELNQYTKSVQLLKEEIADFDLGLSNKIYCFLEVYNGSKFVRCSNSIIVTKEEYEEWKNQKNVLTIR